jgi:hypothetical protein
MEALMPRIERAIVFFLFVFSASTAKSSPNISPLTHISGPDGQMRILVPLPLHGACDVPWCESYDCTGGCVAKWPLLSDYQLEIQFDGEKASRRIELAVYPVTSYWKPDSVSWNYPWATPGGDLFLPREREKPKILAQGKTKGWVKFDVKDEVREASREGLRIYGFAITTPIPPSMSEPESGLLPQEVGAMGKLKSALFRIGFDPNIEPIRFDVLVPPSSN